MRRAYLSLGSNVGDRGGAPRRRRSRSSSTATRYRLSQVYETEPVGGVAQDDFWNLVVEARDRRRRRASCSSAPDAPKRPRGRTRDVRWGPRTLDVDVLLVGDGDERRPRDPRVPHPRLYERAFVLVPLRELAPALVSEDQSGARASGGSSNSVHSSRCANRTAPSGPEREWSRHEDHHRRRRPGRVVLRRRPSRRRPRRARRPPRRARAGWRAAISCCSRVPDDAIAEVAAVAARRATLRRRPRRGLARARRAGAPHQRRASCTRSRCCPTPEVGASRLRGARYSVGGDALVDERRGVARRDGRSVSATTSASLYHATATRGGESPRRAAGPRRRSLAEAAGLALEDFLALAEQALSDVAAMGVRARSPVRRRAPTWRRSTRTSRPCPSPSARPTSRSPTPPSNSPNGDASARA